MGYQLDFKNYYKSSKAVFQVPDLSKGFIPQGLAYDANTDSFFVTGYMDHKENSPIYVIDRKSGSLKNKIYMMTEKGEDFRGHAGGMSILGDSVYVAGSTDACVYEFLISEVINSSNNRVNASEKIGLKRCGDFIRVSFTSADESLLYAGEFHKGFLFYTNKSHIIKQDKTKQKAYILGFKKNDKKEGIPECVYSVPDCVQGACFYKNHMFLSVSYGIWPSKIMTYSLSKIKQCGTKKVLGYDVPLYILNKENVDKTTIIPPMSENIIVVNGEMYIIYEAASNRYKIGKRMGLDKVYKTPIGFFE